ncbi:aspartate/glutamate racemase family protein [Celeribacter indicus]|uniref:Asp/Glu racemase n=1 Tax=Celeribacter indicus TaxID=1208324 RepID=A0A0B5E5M5_9RHOB|nr:aspartate/glutamate racemase family protein [Celeribacter indicus]AJE48660.1 Asp/Glu racemase [Celeribacter indicus]SDX35136.1 allantoin racemase [Celeribacter indicus]
MRIAVINPNTTEAMTEAIGVAAARAAAPGTTILARQATRGPEAIEGPFDGALCLPGLLQAIRGAEAEGADAHVIACFDDTGLDAARALSERPVLGVGEAAMHLASLVSQQFCIVTTLSRSVPTLRQNVRRYGFADRCPQILASDIPVLELHRPESGAREKLAAMILAARDRGAEAAVLGCAGMADFAASLTEDLGLPVIDGVDAAVRLAETLVGAGHRPSKIGGWARPARVALLDAF